MEIILAVNTLEEARRFAGKLSICKVGLSLITELGSIVADRVKDMGYSKVLYDAKFYDIPSIVAEAVAWVPFSAWGITVHVSDDNVLMLKAAKEQVDKTGQMLFGVLKLTSEPADRYVIERRLGICKGFVDGVVCAVQEASYVKEQMPYLPTLCPGIIPHVSQMNDQWRVSTIQQAARSGAVDYVIIGRMLTKAEDPDEALAALVQGVYREY